MGAPSPATRPASAKTRGRASRPTMTAAARKPTARNVMTARLSRPGPPPPITAETNANSTRLSTSSRTAAARAVRPSGLCVLPSSRKMRPVTPMLVAARVAPRKTWPSSEPLAAVTQLATATSTTEATMPIVATRKAGMPTRRRSLVRSSRPMSNIKRTTPSSANARINASRRSDRRNVPGSAASTIPMQTSPTTLGRRARGAAKPARCAATTSSARAPNSVGIGRTPASMASSQRERPESDTPIRESLRYDVARATSRSVPVEKSSRRCCANEKTSPVRERSGDETIRMTSIR